MNLLGFHSIRPFVVLFQESAECQFGAAQGFELARRAGFSAKIPPAGDERVPRFAMRGIFAATRMPCGGDRVAEPSTGRLHDGRCECSGGALVVVQQPAEALAADDLI